MANRLAFLHFLAKQKGIPTKLILLNIMNDPTHISVPEATWQAHTSSVLQSMLGTETPPENVVIVNFDVG